MIKCPFCHFENEDGALFCEQCKSDLSDVAPTPAPPRASAPPPPPPPVKAPPLKASGPPVPPPLPAMPPLPPIAPPPLSSFGGGGGFGGGSGFGPPPLPPMDEPMAPPTIPPQRYPGISDIHAGSPLVPPAPFVDPIPPAAIEPFVPAPIVEPFSPPPVRPVDPFVPTPVAEVIEAEVIEAEVVTPAAQPAHPEIEPIAVEPMTIDPSAMPALPFEAPPPPAPIVAPPPPPAPIAAAAVFTPPAPAPVTPAAIEAPGDGTIPAGAEPHLLVQRGLKRNAKYPIYEGPNYIGRADDKPVDVDLEDQEPPDRVWCSRQHAVIHFENQKLAIEDLNSSNGTYVNRAKIYPGQLHPLKINDIVQIGSVQMKVGI